MPKNTVYARQTILKVTLWNAHRERSPSGSWRHWCSTTVHPLPFFTMITKCILLKDNLQVTPLSILLLLLFLDLPFSDIFRLVTWLAGSFSSLFLFWPWAGLNYEENVDDLMMSAPFSASLHCGVAPPQGMTDRTYRKWVKWHWALFYPEVEKRTVEKGGEHCHQSCFLFLQQIGWGI